MHSSCGETMYRGKKHTVKQLGLPQPSPSKSASQQYRPKLPIKGQRLRVLCLNLGGICSTTYDILAQWLQQDGKAYDILLFQETHFGLGKHETCYNLPGWTVVSSPDPAHRWAGVATLISHRVAQPNDVQFQTWQPGRILQVRIPAGRGNRKTHLDLFNIYQWAWDPDPSKKRLEKRNEVLMRLDKALHTVPRRHSLRIAGDFNCQLQPHAGCIGPCVATCSQLHAPDHHDFAEWLMAHSLCVLNTWSKASGRPTYSMPGTKATQTQIDYVITKNTSSDAKARMVTIDKSLNFSPWRQGSRHFALSTFLRSDVHFEPRPKKHAVPYSRQNLSNSIRQGTFQSDALKQEVAAALHDLDPAQATAEQVNQTLLSACAKIFPAQATSSEPRPWQTLEVQVCVKNMWQAYHSMRRVSHLYPITIIPFRFRPIVAHCLSRDIPDNAQHLEVASQLAATWQDSKSLLSRCFHAIRMFTQFHKQHKVLKQRGQEKRKAKITSTLDAAQFAAEAGDMHKLYKEVRKLSPKNNKERIQIRGPNNQILSHASEHAEIVKHFKSVFTKHAPAEAMPELALHLPISAEEVQLSLRKQPSGKAVPPWLTPPEVWKLCSHDLMPHIQGMIKNYLSPGVLALPDSWTDSWLCLLPKPHKPAKIPKNLRPIALQCPLGKCIARILKQKLLDSHLTQFDQLPQYAYLPARSTLDAISRASMHCAKSRTVIKAQRAEIQDKREGRTPTLATGSAIFSLDMSMAFDLVSQDYLIAALKFAQVGDDIINVALALQRSKYLVSHLGYEDTISLQNGIRQGCTLSPLLWVFATNYMLHQLGQITGTAWIQNGVTAFADDFITTFDVHCKQDADRTQRHILGLLQVLANAGMQVNPEKSSILLRFTGSQLKKWLKSRVKQVQGQQHLSLGTPFKPVNIPMTQCLDYLGVKLSLGNFEDLTLKKRKQAARGSVMRLSKFLFSRKGLSLKHRVRMYITCVRSSLLYGISGVGITKKGLLEMRRFEIKHLRAIAKSPRHLSHESNADLYERLGIKECGEALKHLMQNRIESLERQSIVYPGKADIILWPKEKLNQLMEHQTSLNSQEVDATFGTEVQCPQCQVLVSSLSALKTHFATKHGVSLIAAESLTLQSQRSIDIAEHSVDGAPVCRHCRHSFRKWQSFRKHIATHCPVLHNYHELVRTAHSAMSSQDAADSAPLGLSAQQFVARHSPSTRRVESAEQCSQQSLPIIKDPKIDINSLKDWIQFAEEHGGKLVHHCAICNQWCSAKTGGMKAYLRSCHPEHAQAMKDAEARLRHHYRLKYKGQCRACGFKPASTQSLTHPAKCPTYFQACMLHYIQYPEAKLHVGLSDDQAMKEVSQMFGSHLPALQSAATPSTAPQSSTASTPDHKATNPKRARTQEENWDKGQWNWQQTGWRDQSLSQQVSGDELRAIVAQLTRLVLRHEDTEAATRVDSGFQLYMDTSGDLAMLPRLYSIAMDWKKKKTENPDQLKQSLRVTIFLRVMMELKSRAESALGDTMRPVLQKNGWITTADPPSWGYQKWDPVNKVAVLDQQRTPLPHQRAVELLEKACRLSGLPDMIHKFHSTRPMAQEYKSEILPYILHISNRGEESNALHNILSELSDSYLLRLVGLRMRPMRLKRQPLAISLEQSASKLLAATAWKEKEAPKETTAAPPNKGPTQAQDQCCNPSNSI